MPHLVTVSFTNDTLLPAYFLLSYPQCSLELQGSASIGEHSGLGRHPKYTTHNKDQANLHGTSPSWQIY